jgi:hypothetical protein
MEETATVRQFLVETICELIARKRGRPWPMGKVWHWYVATIREEAEATVEARFPKRGGS